MQGDFSSLSSYKQTNIETILYPLYIVPSVIDLCLIFLHLCILDSFLKNSQYQSLLVHAKPLLTPSHIHFSLSHFALSNMLASYSFEQYLKFDMIISNETYSKTHQTHWFFNYFIIQPPNPTRRPRCTFKVNFHEFILCMDWWAH